MLIRISIINLPLKILFEKFSSLTFLVNKYKFKTLKLFYITIIKIILQLQGLFLNFKF